MFSVTLSVLVSLTGLSYLNFAKSEGVQSGTPELLHPSNSNNPPCTNCYHNHEGYSYGGYLPPHFHHSPEYHRNHPFPPGFKHNPEYHAGSFGNREGRNFGATATPRNSEPKTVEYKNTTINEIPIEYLATFDDADVEELLANYVEGYEPSKDLSFIANRFGDEGQERNAGMIPAKAACTPEKVSVSLASSDDPTVLHIPKCTRIERCGGCCSHKLLSCQPIETETISVQVVKTQYVGAKKLKYLGKEIMPLERHLKCKCSCRVKAEHCLPNQVYKPKECACECANRDEEAKCNRNPDLKYWDYSSCNCKCRFVTECSTGSFYDHNECRCKTTPKRRYIKIERKGITIEDTILAPIDYNDSN